MAVQAEVEVLVLKLEASSEPKTAEDSLDTNKGFNNTNAFLNVTDANATNEPVRIIRDVGVCLIVCAAEDHLEDQGDFLIVPRHQELLGDRAKDCGISVTIEKTGLEDKRQYTHSYVLFRCVSVWLGTF